MPLDDRIGWANRSKDFSVILLYLQEEVLACGMIVIALDERVYHRISLATIGLQKDYTPFRDHDSRGPPNDLKSQRPFWSTLEWDPRVVD